MKARTLAVLAALLLAGCAMPSGGGGGGHDRDKDDDRSKGEERARSYCVQEAKSRGLRVEDVGRIEKVAKKQYEVKLRVDPKNKGKDKGDKKDDDFRVLCRYDDKGRRATIH